jgi:hypothetical protein
MNEQCHLDLTKLYDKIIKSSPEKRSAIKKVAHELLPELEKQIRKIDTREELEHH